MDYRTTKVNRYWKRPKPRVYECNVRDAERFYQDCYKRYLSDKEDAAARAARARSTEAEHSEFFPHLRAGPLRREASARPAAEPTELPPLPTPLAEAVKTRLSSDVASTEVSFTGRVEGLPSYDPSKDDTTHEERILRIKRLKEELGLPPDSKPPPVPSISSMKSEASTRSADGGLGEYESSYKSERTSRSLATGGGPDDSSSYSFRSERSSRMNGTSGLGERSVGDYKYKTDRGSDDYKLSSKSMDYELPKIERKPLNLSPKLERKKNDYSFSSTEKKADRFSSLSSAGGSSASSGRKAVANLDIDDDDTSVVDMMKKLPSSQDILERISKMDLDD